MKSVEEFIESLDDDSLSETILTLHTFILDRHPAIQSKIKFRIPFYYLNKWMCYINPLKNEKAGVEICFLHALQMVETNSFLDFKDRKMVGGIELTSLDNNTLEIITTCLDEAIAINESL